MILQHSGMHLFLLLLLLQQGRSSILKAENTLLVCFKFVAVLNCKHEDMKCPLDRMLIDYFLQQFHMENLWPTTHPPTQPHTTHQSPFCKIGINAQLISETDREHQANENIVVVK